MATTESSRPKVVIVGMCQSGNLSLATALLMLRMHSMGYHRAGFHQCIRGDMTYLDNFVEEFDALRDYPFNIYYERIAERHPECKFILTYRKDANHWFDKILEYSQQDRRHTEVHRFWWGQPVLRESDRENCLKIHAAHVHHVRNVLAGRLLEWTVDDHQGWESICPFLGVPVPACDFPTKETRSNIIHTFSREQRIGWMVWDSMIPERIVNIVREEPKRVVQRQLAQGTT